jgi:primary-amine oxidase
LFVFDAYFDQIYPTYHQVDFDIVGLNNSLMETTTSIQEVVFPWNDEEWETTVPQQVISRRYIESEDESRLFYPPNFRGGYAIVNQDATNAWGIPRGYVVHPGYSPIYNVCHSN